MAIFRALRPTSPPAGRRHLRCRSARSVVWSWRWKHARQCRLLDRPGFRRPRVSRISISICLSTTSITDTCWDKFKAAMGEELQRRSLNGTIWQRGTPLFSEFTWAANSCQTGVVRSPKCRQARPDSGKRSDGQPCGKYRRSLPLRWVSRYGIARKKSRPTRLE
jgi:hypothetical protein